MSMMLWVKVELALIFDKARCSRVTLSRHNFYLKTSSKRPNMSMCVRKLTYDHVREKINNLGFRPGLTQTKLYKHRRWLEA